MALQSIEECRAYVIRVDNTTGIVDVVPQYAGRADLPETVTRTLLRSCVEICERFVWALAEADYEQCGAYNAPRRMRHGRQTGCRPSRARR